MSRTRIKDPIHTPESKRLLRVFNDFGGSQKAFSEVLKTSLSSTQRMLSGEQAITISVATAVCFKLGYSPAWFIAGVGKAKIKDEKPGKLITDLYQLRTEIEILNARIDVMQARMKSYEEKK